MNPTPEKPQDREEEHRPEGDGLLSPEAAEEARSLVRDAFRLFADHTKRLTERLAEHNEKRSRIRERIERGAGQTDGRIV